MNSIFVFTNSRPRSAPDRTPTVHYALAQDAGALILLSLALWILVWTGCAHAQSEPTRAPGRANSAMAASTATDKLLWEQTVPVVLHSVPR